MPPIFFPDEHTRLLAYGLISAVAFAIALASTPAERLIVPAICGVLLLRWVPFSEVIVWRELVVLAGAVAIVLIIRTPVGVVSALAISLVTPIFPARTMLFPFVVAALTPVPIIGAIAFAITAFFVRYSIAVLCVVAAIVLLMQGSRPRPAAGEANGQTRWSVLHVPVYAIAFLLFAMWPWSGIVARAFPKFLVATPPPAGNQPVWIALEHGQSVSMDAPPGKHAIGITASGANASRLRPGTVMGTVEVIGTRGDITHRRIRIGDIADFGFMRREHFFASRNPPPKNPIDDVKGYGASAWLHAAGYVILGSADEIRSVRFSAAGDLPPGAKLQIEAVNFE